MSWNTLWSPHGTSNASGVPRAFNIVLQTLQEYLVDSTSYSKRFRSTLSLQHRTSNASGVPRAFNIVLQTLQEYLVNSTSYSKRFRSTSRIQHRRPNIYPTSISASVKFFSIISSHRQTKRIGIPSQLHVRMRLKCVLLN